MNKRYKILLKMALLSVLVVGSSFCFLRAMQFNPFAAVQKQVKNEGLSERERIEEDIKILQALENDVSKLKGGIANISQKSMVSGKKLYTLDWASLEPGETVADTVQIIKNKMAELKNRLENLSVEEKPASSAAVADVGISSQVNQEVLSKIKQSNSVPKADVDPSKIDSKIDSKNDRLASLTKDRPSFSGRSKPTRKPRKNAAGEKVVLQAEIASAPPAEVVEVAQPAPVDVAAPQNEPQRRPQENLGVKKIASPLDSILGAIEKGVMVALNGVPQNIKNSVRDKFAWLDKSVRDLFAADKRRPKGIVIVNDGFGRPMFEITRDKIDQSIRKVVLLGIMEHFGYKQPLAAGGYLFVDRLQEILKGMRYAADDGGTLKLAYWLDCEEGDPRAEEIMSKLIADYKIHLMPEGMMISEVITLFTAIQKNEKLRNAINEVKFEVTDCDDESVKNEQYPYPKMVIYPASGKDKAQFVLNEIFRIFGQRKGLDVTPRFNAKITSLIYYAQGNGDEKTEENENFFESDKVVYNATITGSSAGPRGYYLENPAARRRPPVQQGSKLQGGVPASTVEVPQTIPGAEAEPARKPRIGFSEVGEDQGLVDQKNASVSQDKQKIDLSIVALKNVEKFDARENYYDILGVARNASSSDIAKAYRKLSLTAHPDKGGDSSIFNRIKKAYDILSNVDEREAYDQLFAATPAQREQATNALNNLMQNLQDEKNKDLDAQINEVRHVLTLPLQNESKKELRVLLKELESIKQLQDFNTALNTTLNTAIEKLDVNTIKQTINRNQEFVNTTGLTFGYTPLIAIIAKKDLSEGDREKQRAIFKYLLSVSGIDVHKMSDEKDPKNNRNALDAVLLKVSTSKNNKVLNDHYRKMAKNLIDLGVKLKKFATQPQAQEILQELSARESNREATQRIEAAQLAEEQEKAAQEEAARIAQLRAEEEAARLAQLKAEQEVAQKAEAARIAQLMAQEAQRLVDEKAARKSKKAQINKQFAATFHGKGLHQEGAVQKMMGQFKDKMETFRQSTINDDLELCVEKIQKHQAKLDQLYNRKKVLKQEHSQTLQSIEQLEARIKNLRKKIKSGDEQLRKASSIAVAA